MTTAPRIPRRRTPVIPLYSMHWYESTPLRVLAIVLGSTFTGVALHALLAWLGSAP